MRLLKNIQAARAIALLMIMDVLCVANAHQTNQSQRQSVTYRLCYCQTSLMKKPKTNCTDQQQKFKSLLI